MNHKRFKIKKGFSPPVAMVIGMAVTLLIMLFLWYELAYANNNNEVVTTKIEYNSMCYNYLQKVRESQVQDARGMIDLFQSKLHEENDILREYFQVVYNVHFTSYNNSPLQTDSSPCQGAMGNVCKMYDNGLRPIALSQDLVEWARADAKITFKGGEIVMLKQAQNENQDSRCNGEFVVIDTMNARYSMRGDIFFPLRDKHLNTSCRADIRKTGRLINQ